MSVMGPPVGPERLSFAPFPVSLVVNNPAPGTLISDLGSTLGIYRGQAPLTAIPVSLSASSSYVTEMTLLAQTHGKSPMVLVSLSTPVSLLDGKDLSFPQPLSEVEIPVSHFWQKDTRLANDY